MLGKLFKHEWNATARRYGLFYLVLAAMTLFAAVLHRIPVENMVFRVAETIFLGIYVLTLIAAMVGSLAMAVIRFYQNMVADEGYLTFTLPVKVEELVLVKIFVAIFWQIITVCLLFGSVFCVYVLGHVEVSTFVQELIVSVKGAGMSLTLVAVVLLVTMLYQLILCFFSISVGQSFQGNKIVGSVITYLVVDFGLRMIMMVVLFTGVVIIGFSKVEEAVALGSGIGKMLTGWSIWFVMMAIAGYIGSCYFLKKKLNLN